MAGRPAAPPDSLAAAAAALCAALRNKDATLAVAGAAALGHAGLRAPLPLPLGAPPRPDKIAAGGEAPDAPASAAEAAAGPSANGGAGASDAPTAMDTEGAAGAAAGAGAPPAKGASPGAAEAAGQAGGEPGAGAAAAADEAGGATRLGAMAGAARLMADKEPKARRLFVSLYYTWVSRAARPCEPTAHTLGASIEAAVCAAAAARSSAAGHTCSLEHRRMRAAWCCRPRAAGHSKDMGFRPCRGSSRGHALGRWRRARRPRRGTCAWATACRRCWPRPPTRCWAPRPRAPSRCTSPRARRCAACLAARPPPRCRRLP